MRGGADRSGARRITSAALGVLAAVALLLSLLTLYANRVLLDSDQFANHVGAAVEKPAVKDEIGRRITDGIVEAQPDLVAVRPIIEGVAAGVVGSGAFNDLLRAAVRDLHRAIFKRDQNTVTLTVADVGAVVSSALEQFAPRVAKKVRGRGRSPDPRRRATRLAAGPGSDRGRRGAARGHLPGAGDRGRRDRVRAGARLAPPGLAARGRRRGRGRGDADRLSDHPLGGGRSGHRPGRSRGRRSHLGHVPRRPANHAADRRRCRGDPRRRDPLGAQADPNRAPGRGGLAASDHGPGTARRTRGPWR